MQNLCVNYKNEVGDLSVSTRGLLKCDRRFRLPITLSNAHYWDGWFSMHNVGLRSAIWHRVLKNLCQSVTTTQKVILQAYDGMPISLYFLKAE